MQGTIKGLNLDRGFGFIEVIGQKDVFFHVKNLATELPFDEILKGRRVVFDVAETPKGPAAINIQAAD